MADYNKNDDYNKNRMNNKHLFYLNELSDYKVASDDPDVRGWKVKDSDNRVIGKVDNLLVNKNTERVVYLDVEVDKSIIEANHDPYGQPADSDVHEFINKDGENHIIIPVGLVNLNDDDNYVYTDRINHRTFAETKRIEKGANVNRDYEVVVLESYDRDTNYRDNSGIGSTTGTGRNNPDYDTRGNDSTFSDSNRRDRDNDNETLTGKNRRDNDNSDSRGTGTLLRGDKSSFVDDDRKRDKDNNFSTSANRRSDDDSIRRGSEMDSRDNDSLGLRGSDKREGGTIGTRGDNDSLSRNSGSYDNERNRDRNYEDDDSFYERREFDRSNFRRKNS